MERVNILGVQVHRLSLMNLLAFIEATVIGGQRGRVTYFNAHAANLAYEEQWFRDFLNQSEVVFCDGYGVKWAASFLGRPLPARLTPPDWLPELADLSNKNDFSLFLLGSRPGVTQQALARLQEHSSALRVAGQHHGYFDKTLGTSQNQAVLHSINAARPNILLLGFGMPLQERWLMENWEHLDVNIVVTVGAGLDYLSGSMPRGPQWMTGHGFEWLARLLIEPGRLWKRYLIGNPLFLWRIFKQRLGWLPFDP
jgi:N-acetylglucosaminyldiphosphoundecaprenol N-acetyl-beta-D-mannosaminyltransferase